MEQLQRINQDGTAIMINGRERIRIWHCNIDHEYWRMVTADCAEFLRYRAAICSLSEFFRWVNGF